VSGAARITDVELREATEFLFAEAECLDEGRFRDWLALVAEDVRYRVYAPTIRDLADQTRDEVPLLDETHASLRSRVEQLSTPAFTVAENPRSLDRRFVANVRAAHDAETGGFAVRSNFLLRRARGVGVEPQILSATRADVLSHAGGGLVLRRRTVRLDDAVVQVRNLSFLF
jgi:3-phenylpropionate/cinnamic acid dioxygenase small subunit